MFAVHRLARGGNVNSLILLGPTFVAGNENGTTLGYDGWSQYMSKLTDTHGVHILSVDDKAPLGGASSSFVSQGDGVFTFAEVDYPHVGSNGVTQDQSFLTKVLNWIKQPGDWK